MGVTQSFSGLFNTPGFIFSPVGKRERGGGRKKKKEKEGRKKGKEKERKEGGIRKDQRQDQKEF